jgi:hypothetical protein
MRQFLSLVLVTALGVALIVQGSAASSSGQKVLEFETMAAVVGPFVGTTNPIRGVNGGGLPWQIEQGQGELSSDGKLEVQVEGLVLLNAAPVPVSLRGTNPVPSFRAIVSCLTISGGSSTTANVATGTFPATTTGDSEIEATISLPSPCFAPIIFVTSPGNMWFAVTGN